MIDCPETKGLTDKEIRLDRLDEFSARHHLARIYKAAKQYYLMTRHLETGDIADDYSTKVDEEMFNALLDLSLQLREQNTD